MKAHVQIWMKVQTPLPKLTCLFTNFWIITAMSKKNKTKAKDYNIDTSKDDYFRVLLMLYHLWRDEQEVR
jgi:hypothetical protein